MSKHIKDITINPKTDRVTLRFETRDSWGIVGRNQITVARREFEDAMREAGIIVPWQDASRV